MTRSSLKRAAHAVRRGAPASRAPVVRSSRLMPLPKVPIHSRPSLSSANEVMLRSVKPSSALAREVAERPGARIPLGEAAGLGAYPQRAAAVLEQRDDVVVGQRTRFRLRRGDSWRTFRWPDRTTTGRRSCPTHRRPWLSMSSDCTRLSGSAVALPELLAVAIDAPALAARIVAAEARIGADPDHAVGGFGQRAHAQRLARAAPSSGGSAMRDDVEIGGRQAIEAAARCRPACRRCAGAGWLKTRIVGERIRLGGRMAQAAAARRCARRRWRRRRRARRSTAGRGGRAPACARAAGRARRAAAPARRACRCCALRNTTPPPSVAIHKPSSLATSEEIQPFGSDSCVAAIVAQLAEFVAVEAVEPVFGAEPHEAFAVLDDGVHGLLRQAFLEAVALHAERRSRAGRQHGKARRAARRSRRARIS